MEKNIFERQYTITRRALVSLGLGAGVLFLSGCSSPEILPNREATVIEHQHDDPHTHVISLKPPAIANDPEEFRLVLEQCDRNGDEFADQDGCVVDTVEVSQGIYNQYSDGSTIILGEN